eukprot:759935-Hanusia_phi.AAC.2
MEMGWGDPWEGREILCYCPMQRSRSGHLGTEMCLTVNDDIDLLQQADHLLGAMAEGGKADMIIGLFSTTREFDVNGCLPFL